MVDWYSLMPTVVALTDYADTTSGTRSIYTACMMNTSASGSTNMDVEATLQGPYIQASFDFVTNFAINDEDDAASDITVAKTIRNAIQDTINIIDDVIFIYPISGLTDVRNVHAIVTNLVNRMEDIDIDFKIYIGSLPEDNNINVDVTISDDKRFTFPASMFCTVSGLKNIEADIQIALGRFNKVAADIFSTAALISGIESNIFCTVSGIEYIGSEAETALGYNKFFSSDIFSTTVTNSGIECDVRTWSLYFGSFFLDIEEFTTASATAWVDIIDYMWPIDTTNSYFEVDGIQVGVTFSGIPNGQRMFYNPPNDFDADDVITYTVHAQNTMGDIREQNYYLLYGYDIDFNGLVDWGANKQIDIVAKAKNKAFCPQWSSDAFYFITKDLHSLDLGSTIKPVAPWDLGSSLRTQSTAFYYGKTYTVTVSGIKDFAGNELSPFNYSFTIRTV